MWPDNHTKITGGFLMQDDVKSLSHSKWKMQVSYNVCTEIPEASNLWQDQSRYRKNTEGIK